MYVNNPFNQTMSERWEREELAAEAHEAFFDAEFPNWRELQDDEERFVSETDYFAAPPVFRRYGNDDTGRWM